jgi:uncharacterized protein YhbP (UPF0306 family)
MNKSANGIPSDKLDLKSLTERLITDQSTLTLATAHGDTPWAAAVYYVNRGFTLYFFSDPSSRHIQESLKSGQTSGAISVPASTWKEIRGIQASGIVSLVPPGMESIQSLRAYLKKFPFTKDFFDSKQEMNLSAIMNRFKVRLYRFQPSVLYYLDNHIRFGFRERVEFEMF